MSMQIWLDQRAVKLLQDINAIPFTDDHDIKKVALIRRALREASQEVFKRAAERTLADLISEDAMNFGPPR